MKGQQTKNKQNKKSQIAAIVSIAAILILAIILLIPAIPYITRPDEFRAYMDARGPLGILIFAGMVILQVISTVIPAGPFEFAAGFVFGVVRGTLICDAAMLAGSSIAFFLSRRFGLRLLRLFRDEEDIRRTEELLKSGKRQTLYAFLFVLIPALPKDLLPYLLGMSEMKYPTFAAIMFFGRIPSIVITALCADALFYQNSVMLVLMILFAGAFYVGSLFLLKKYHDGSMPAFGKKKVSKGERNERTGEENERGQREKEQPGEECETGQREKEQPGKQPEREENGREPHEGEQR